VRFEEDRQQHPADTQETEARVGRGYGQLWGERLIEKPIQS
jgi:hypothetical protein